MMNIYARKSQDKSTGQTENHVPWICLPQVDLPTVHSCDIQKQCLPEGPLGGLPSLSLTTKGSWIQLWGVGCQVPHFRQKQDNLSYQVITVTPSTGLQSRLLQKVVHFPCSSDMPARN